MNDKSIEARLERSLRTQVKAPRLEKRFDSAVWAKIEAQAVRAPAAPRAAASTNWLFVINGIGIGVAFVLFCVFGLQAFSGLETNVTLPEVSVAPATIAQITKIGVQAITIGSMVFALMFTSWGRRLRAEFS